MTQQDADVAVMLKKMLSFNKVHTDDLTTAMVLGFTIGVMGVIEPEDLDSTVRDCLAHTYVLTNKELCGKYGTDDILSLLLKCD